MYFDLIHLKSSRAAVIGRACHPNQTLALAVRDSVLKRSPVAMPYVTATEPNPLDLKWNEQGTPHDTRACEAAVEGGGYWQPWLQGSASEASNEL